MTTTNYLISLYNLNTSTEYMSIYQAVDNNLTCVPFGTNDTTTALKINYVHYDYERVSWQHVSCKFKRRYDITASIYSQESD
jgi:hypothetical protein